MSETNNIFQLIKTAQNILIIFKGVLSPADINNLTGITSYISYLNNNFQILCIDKQTESIINYASQNDIEIIYELKPSEYVVTIDYGSSGVEKVVYDTDQDNGKLVFKIVPSKAGFSFDKVEFNEGGAKYDATILIGTLNPKDLGDFYDTNEYLFRENNFSILKNTQDITQAFCNTHENMPTDVLDKVLMSNIANINLIDGYPDQESISNVFKLSDLGGNLSKAIHEKYYSKDEKYIDLFKILFSNIKVSGDIVYSYVRKSQTENLTIDDVKNLGRIPFNIVSKYKLALVFFELSDDKVYLVVESNDINKYSASTIAGVFEGEGDPGHAFCKVDDMGFDDLNHRFWPILKDLYNVDITTKADSVPVDNLPKVLTKGRRNSKNKGFTGMR